MFKFRWVSVFLCLTAFAGQGDVPHYDHRHAPHLQFSPDSNVSQDLAGVDLAMAFLSENATTYGFSSDLTDLRLVREKASLLATHFHFQQQIGPYDVIGGEIVVSIGHESGKVDRVYNTIYPAGDLTPTPAQFLLSEDEAYDLAWDDLGVHGELISQPQAKLAYLPEGRDFRLVWITTLGVAAPFGYWESHVDAVSGRILKVVDTRISRKPVASVPEKYNGPREDRNDAFARFEARETLRQAERQARAASATLADGTGIVFDPDPRTTLNDETITDTSSAATFTPAYVTRTLANLELTGGTYFMSGAWIDIIDFESPATPPSTSSTGNWDALRGDNAFNDAVTYFHIDQNQTYIQSLGFTGPTGIQEGPIGTDTDGLSGADNSHFIPSSNRMAFGHGCVDDNEDADVILHEYGHAIHHSINSNWGGGDAGAIGEGFGDYWAGSYSYSTPNGPIFHPEWVFTWDGHSSCWAGRDLDRTDLIYDPSRTYGAHSGIPGGGQSDELWSAPVFQAFLDLIGDGRPRDEMDQIVLESHFGLGSGVTMRVLANATIAAAGQLFPKGPHAEAYTSRFLAQNHIEIPHVAWSAGDVTVVSEPGENGVADPGETVDIQLEIINSGNLGATAVSGTLTSPTVGVTVDDGSATYPDVNVGQNVTGTYTISISPDFECGDTIDLELLIQWSDGSVTLGGTTLDYTLNTGTVIGMSGSNNPSLPINDNATVSDTFTISGTGTTVTAAINVDVDITHTFIGDLTVVLEAPNGTQVTLHNGTGGSADDIVGNYPGTLTPAESLSALIGAPHDGTWRLTITDSANGDTGTLNSWGVNDVLGYECEDSMVIPCPGDFDDSGTVDVEDYNYAMGNWSTENGDYNGDGTTSIIDLFQIEEAYGACP